MHLINVGADAKFFHIVGFSLGAHIAGCAGEILKGKGYKVGRITGNIIYLSARKISEYD